MTGTGTEQQYAAGWYPTPEGDRERYWDGNGWTDQFREPEPEYEISPVGIAVALLGAIAMVIAVFLPRAETSAFTLGGIQENTLIQSGEGGWVFIALGVGILGSVYRSWQAGRRSWAVLVMGGIAIALAIYNGSDDALQLYRLSPSGNPDLSGGSVEASAGIGIYVAGAGGALALLGGWQMRRDAVPRQARQSETAEPGSNKQCPECAETVLAAARVCKHCGYRFAPAATAEGAGS